VRLEFDSTKDRSDSEPTVGPVALGVDMGAPVLIAGAAAGVLEMVGMATGSFDSTLVGRPVGRGVAMGVSVGIAE
jgi:hypothetical protein